MKKVTSINFPCIRASCADGEWMRPRFPTYASYNNTNTTYSDSPARNRKRLFLCISPGGNHYSDWTHHSHRCRHAPKIE